MYILSVWFNETITMWSLPHRMQYLRKLYSQNAPKLISALSASPLKLQTRKIKTMTHLQRFNNDDGYQSSTQNHDAIGIRIRHEGGNVV
jgi:hypothetical protein